MQIQNLITLPITLPLQRFNAVSNIELSSMQQSILSEVHELIESGEYKCVTNNCLCGSDQGVIITEQDRFGLPFKFKICQTCGLIRTDPILDVRALRDFYSKKFSLLHRDAIEPTKKYLDYVIATGENLLTFLSGKIDVQKLEDVCEIGCASGANLLPFYEKGKSVIGFDYDEKYMAWGIDRGLNLKTGSYENISDCSQDLIILSHVLEHFTDPLNELLNVIAKIRNGKFLFVEVPGIFSIHSRWKRTPILYFQNDHIFHYQEKYLVNMFRALNLTIIYSDEWCRFILRKPENWEMAEAEVSLEFKARSSVEDQLTYLKWTYIRNAVRSRLVVVLEALRIKAFLKSLIWRKRS